MLRDGLHSELIVRDWHQSGDVEVGTVIRSINWVNISGVDAYAISCDSSCADIGRLLPAHQDRGAVDTSLSLTRGSRRRYCMVGGEMGGA